MSDCKNQNQNCISLNESANVNNCPNTPVTPIVTPPGNTTINVSVTLAEVNVTSNLVAKITFPEPVLEIKDIKKRVTSVQCKLVLPSAAAPGTFANGPFPLHIKGYVRKNIQYATPSGESGGSCVSSTIKSLTVDTPFECMSLVTLNLGSLAPAQLPVQNTRTEFDFYREQDLGPGHPEKDHFLSSDLSQFHQSITQFYNRMPYCELISSTILEYDEAIDREPFYGNEPYEEGFFYNIIEKMTLTFTVKVLQNQQVIVAALT